jgi:hypothetical protein
MKRIAGFLGLAAAIILAAVPSATADPRMEINNNFCHFILDDGNTDNEAFAAGCDATISTVEVLPPAGGTVLCENLAARGYGERSVVVPQSAVAMPPGTSLTFTSDASDTPCTMVESNGREYRSDNWKSTVQVESTARRGMVRVKYTVLCTDGRY